MTDSSRRGGIAAALLISVVVAVTIALFVAGALTGLYVARNIRVEKEQDRSGESVRIETPVGAIRVQTGKHPTQLGIPVYPGAITASEAGKTASVELDFGQEHKDLSIVAAKYTTEDRAQKVLEYYRKELPHWILSQKRHGAFQLEYTEGGYKRVIAIREHDGTTEIGLASFGAPQAN